MSRSPKGDRDGIAFREWPKASPFAGMGRLSEKLPTLTQHPRDVAVGSLHAEKLPPVIGSIPTFFVREGSHVYPFPEYEWPFLTGPRIGVYVCMDMRWSH